MLVGRFFLPNFLYLLVVFSYEILSYFGLNAQKET